MKNRIAILSLFAAFFVPAVGSKAAPQSQSNKASIAGTLTDPAGAPVAEVQVTAQPDASSAGQPVSVASSSDGSYSLSLPAGRYRLRFSRKSFAARELVLTVASGESRVLNLHLDLEPLSSSVVVTAQSVPTPAQQTTPPTDFLSRETISNRQAVSLPELLEFSPGIAIGRTGPFGGSASIFLNGGNSNFTKVLVDGTPINPPGSAVDFSSVTTENIDKVEIVRGAESAIYGSDAVSGVIQLFTHRGDTRIPAFSVYSEGGNFSSARGGGGLTGIPGATLTPGAVPDLFQGYGQKIFSANARWEFTSGSHWHHQLIGTDSYTRQRSFANPGDVFSFDSVLSFNRAAVNAQSSYVSRNFIATAGYQYEVENAGINFVLPGHLRRNNQAGYLDFRYTPVSRLTLDFGGRVEANGNFGTRVVPRIGGTYILRFGKGFFGDTRYRAFYGQGIKEPRFDQTFGTDPCFPGNPDLKPEASKGWTTGFDQKLASDRWKVSVDYFYTRFYDIVSFANCSPGGLCQVNPSCQFGNGTFFNTDLAFARGINLVSEFRPRKWLFINGNYTYDDTRVVKSENPFADPSLEPGNHLIRRPVNSGSFGINLNVAHVNWNFIGYFSGVRTDSNFVDPAQTTNPGYARFDMAASYNVTRGLFVTARAINLFDKQYQDALGFPALGRYYMFGLRYAFTGRN